MQEKSCKPFAAYSNHVYGWCYEIAGSLLCTYKTSKKGGFLMKATGNLYSKIYDMENLKRAHKNAKRGKGWYAGGKGGRA